MVLTVIAVHDEIFVAFNVTSYFNHGRISKCFSKRSTGFRGVARGGPGVPVTPPW